MIVRTQYPLFPNGTSHEIWREANCESCTKSYDEKRRVWPCPIERAIDLASMGDGTVSKRIAERLGYTEEMLYVPPCPEKKEEKQSW